MTTNTLIERAQSWLTQDPDPETRAELEHLIEQQDLAELGKRFDSRLQFGTAGLRGRLQAGTNGMNRVLVAQAAKGLADYLLQHHDNPSIVIGCDARKNSHRFALDTAEIMQGAGIKAMLLPAQLPTPVLAYAVRALNTDAGVMVTASHNPPEDNGYKVYLGNQDAGAQIVSPTDAEIAACIEQAAQIDIREYARSQDYQQLDNQIEADYCKVTASLAAQTPAPLNYVYTAMHGVGRDTFYRTLKLANYPLPTPVIEQCEPDGNFPTVSFPNPEEDGALDLAFATAEKQNCELIIANDPDADRLAVAIYQDGQWRRLHGNTIGCWLAWEAAKKAENDGKTGTLACSLVSSPQLKKIADAYQLNHEETLTGFKWIGRVNHLLFGYEEALGYLVDPEKVHDKDGISAAMAFLNLALRLKDEGITFADYEKAFTEKFGASASGQVSIRKNNIAEIVDTMEACRQSPPQNIAGATVVESIDHLQTEKQNNILVFHLKDGNSEARVIFRPSGTEPKLKIYLDSSAPTSEEAEEILSRLHDALEKQYQA